MTGKSLPSQNPSSSLCKEEKIRRIAREHLEAAAKEVEHFLQTSKEAAPRSQGLLVRENALLREKNALLEEQGAADQKRIDRLEKRLDEVRIELGESRKEVTQLRVSLVEVQKTNREILKELREEKQKSFLSTVAEMVGSFNEEVNVHIDNALYKVMKLW